MLPVYLEFAWPKISHYFKKPWFLLLENHTLYLKLLQKLQQCPLQRRLWPTWDADWALKHSTIE